MGHQTYYDAELAQPSLKGRCLEAGREIWMPRGRRHRTRRRHRTATVRRRGQDLGVVTGSRQSQVLLNERSTSLHNRA